MKRETFLNLRAFLIELAVYAALVIAYFFAVLHFLGGWLFQLQQHHRFTYAGVALLLIIGQAVVLENVTTFLLRIIRGRTE
jgi:NADH:ubiquinone oxidoreductase subunit H